MFPYPRRLPAVSDSESVERDLRDYIDGQAVFYAGTANSIMQLGWPAVGYGVMESRVDSGSVMKVPRKRLRTTVTYLAVAMLGTDAERAAYRTAVNRQHRQVFSTDESPVSYNAFSRDLQLWVAACLYYGAVDVHDRLHGPMDTETADWFYEQAARLGTTLQMRREQWPADRAAFELYWKEALEQVRYDEPVRRYLNGLLDLEQLPPRQRKRLAPFHRWVNTGFLPPEFREAMGLAWSDEDQVKHDRLCRRTGIKNRRRPRWVRMFPINLFLADFRVRRALRRPLV
jgi:uncharacterized protein (DUF2236 family)